MQITPLVVLCTVGVGLSVNRMASGAYQINYSLSIGGTVCASLCIAIKNRTGSPVMDCVHWSQSTMDLSLRYQTLLPET